ncbi:SUMO-activating enzyme subunit 2 [Bacillus rossius redtenbacheri]|uniref:SUMO-activating enzyme subunit 2 n=1 Tax=Bacillus rossius redtenbacheri TaxID=93214 RepID=UPI002FDD7F22
MASRIPGIFSENLNDLILKSKVLVVGAGGIGCELLKNLVFTGFENIVIVDMDTIEVSNLNRQFLFQKKHVGQPKAIVARESALRFNPNANIEAIHDSIIGEKYGDAFFRKFDIVMNALDNSAARLYVNRLCVNADVPLIESGTAGYNGQVELIKKGLSECYACMPKPRQKSFASCTIRNTPSEPIHCIVWAKHLFNQLFGEEDEEEDISPDTADPEAAGDAAAESLKADAVARVSTRTWAKDCSYNSAKLLRKLFFEDIKYLLSMTNLWENRNRKRPVPLDLDNVPDEVAGSSKAEVGPGLTNHRLWSVAECVRIFTDAVAGLKKKAEVLKEGDYLVWDKDNKDDMNFVAACANIRMHIFGIPQKTCFDVKAMAGNIVPAIATTNAIVAGQIVIHALRVLEGRLKDCQTVYVRMYPNSKRQVLVPEKYLTKPSEECYICANVNQVLLTVDLEAMTLKALEDQVLKQHLGMSVPDVMDAGSGKIIISDDVDYTETATLAEMGVVDGTILAVDDLSQSDCKMTLTVSHAKPEAGEPSFKLSAKIQKPDRNGVDVLEETSPEKKRKLADDNPTSSKKQKVECNTIEYDDDDDDIIISIP